MDYPAKGYEQRLNPHPTTVYDAIQEHKSFFAPAYYTEAHIDCTECGTQRLEILGIDI